MMKRWMLVLMMGVLPVAMTGCGGATTAGDVEGSTESASGITIDGTEFIEIVNFSENGPGVLRLWQDPDSPIEYNIDVSPDRSLFPRVGEPKYDVLREVLLIELTEPPKNYLGGGQSGDDGSNELTIEREGDLLTVTGTVTVRLYDGTENLDADNAREMVFNVQDVERTEN